MERAIFLVLLAVVFNGAHGFSKYGRSCKDIGCLNNEVCVMQEDPCSYYNREQCGKYPTCKSNGEDNSHSCDKFTCPPTQICHLDNGTPKCVPQQSSSTHVKPVQSDSGAPSAPYPAPAPAAGGLYPSITTPRPKIPQGYPGQGGYSGGSPNSGYPGYSGSQGSQQSGGYPGYPQLPNSGGYPGYPSQGSGYPSGGYPGYPSQGSGYPSQGSGYPSQSGYPGYPNQQGGYPSQGGYPNQGGYNQGGYNQGGYHQRGYQQGSQQGRQPPKSGSPSFLDKLTDQLKVIGLVCVLFNYLTMHILHP